MRISEINLLSHSISSKFYYLIGAITVCHGIACLSVAWQGVYCMAQFGWPRLGEARYGIHGGVRQSAVRSGIFRRGVAWNTRSCSVMYGTVRYSMARYGIHGKAENGLACQCEVRHCSESPAVSGWVRYCRVWLVAVRSGKDYEVKQYG